MGTSASPLCTVPVPQCKFPLHSCNDNAHCQDPCPGSPSSARETTIRHGPHPSRAQPPPLPCWPPPLPCTAPTPPMLAHGGICLSGFW